MKKKTAILSAAAAACLLTCAAIPPAYAYFTAYTEAAGVQPIAFEHDTDIDEPEPVNWTKHLTIRNEGTEAVYVRAAAFAGSSYTLSYSGTGWSDGGDGYWYYADPVQPGGAAAELLVAIGNIPKDAAEGDEFNVAVVYESVPALYGEDGAPYADWTQTVETVQE